MAVAVTLAGLGLGLAAVALVVAGVLTRRPVADVPDLDGYLVRWSALHGGYDMRTGSRVARGWLTGVFVLCRPLARAGVLPDVLTGAGVLATGLAALLAGLGGLGGRWPLVAAVVLTVAAALDNADGCVAVLTDRSSAWGYVLDSLADRASDVLALVALAVVGAPTPLVVVAGGVLGTLEYVRARAAGAGMDEVGVVTVGERPGRLITAIFTLLGVGLVPGHAAALATLGAAVLLALSGVGLAQVLVAVRRRLG